MTSGTIATFWTALLALNPLICWGLFPSASGGASTNPRKAWPFAVIGTLGIFIFGVAAWTLHPLVNGRPHLAWVELPLQLLILLIINRTLRLATESWPALSEQLPLFHLNFLALASGLLLLAQPLSSWPAALLALSGMSLGFGISFILIAFLRERLESRRFSRSLSGWPLFLVLAAVIWTVCQGLLLLVK
jgi:Na+-translocating ferredoxin:NAD+ oxidoreductase RnfA subunit